MQGWFVERQSPQRPTSRPCCPGIPTRCPGPALVAQDHTSVPPGQRSMAPEGLVGLSAAGQSSAMASHPRTRLSSTGFLEDKG